jgi:hypothetical protein
VRPTTVTASLYWADTNRQHSSTDDYDQPYEYLKMTMKDEFIPALILYTAEPGGTRQEYHNIRGLCASLA